MYFMKRIHIPIIFIVVLFNFCTGVKTSMSVQDEHLRNKIIGTWRTFDVYRVNRETINFSKDGSFNDTLFAKLPFVINTYLPEYVVTGEFYVENGLVKFRDVELQYHKKADDNSIINFTEYFYPRSINFDGNDLLLQRLQILNPIDHPGDKLDGEWELLLWIVTYDRNADSKFNSGWMRQRYNFNPDTKICVYTSEYLFDSPLKNETLKLNYEYNGNYLEITPLVYEWLRFINNELHWIRYDNMLYKKVQ